LIEPHAADIAAAVDTVVVSLDGDRETHDAIRRVKNGFDRIARGIMALRSAVPAPRLIARSVLQRGNAASIADTIAAAHAIGFDEISFLAADVSSTAFNREVPWAAERAAEISIGPRDLDDLRSSIDRAIARQPALFANGFIAGGRAALDRIHQYYSALAGQAAFPTVECNAPWVSAVLEPEGELRPCFFQPGYGNVGEDFRSALNAPAAIAFRQGLDVGSNATCQRCVCSLNLPLTREV
jgi:MoaA/NifB/PqqE/SkfB family radical SAM enzyme